jgi:hypothetical protein
MKTIAVFVSKLLGVIALEYVVLLVTALVFWPLPDDGSAGFFQSSMAEATLFRTEPKYVVYGRKALLQNGPMIIVLGSSNAGWAIHLEPFRERPLQSYVANLSIPGSNVTQIAQVYSLVSEIIPPERRKAVTYLIGIWYGIFGTDASRWRAKPTDIEIELARYGLYQKSNLGWRPLISVEHLDLFNVLIRPMLVLDKEIKGTLRPTRVWLEKGNVAVGGRSLNSTQMADYISFWKRYLDSPEGRLDNEQFAALEALIQRMIAAGSRVMLLDMPIPDWHKNLSPFQIDYISKIQPLINRVHEEGVTYIKIGGDYKDVEFIDEVHPIKEIGDRWSAEIVRELQAILAKQ